MGEAYYQVAEAPVLSVHSTLCLTPLGKKKIKVHFEKGRNRKRMWKNRCSYRAVGRGPKK